MKFLYILFGILLWKSASILAASTYNINTSKVPLPSTERSSVDTETIKENVPYIVSIGFSTIARSHICAGVIIGKEWVLTAAHCLDNIKKILGVTIGFPVLAGDTSRQLGEMHTADFTFAHKDFARSTGYNDVALVHVSPPFQFSERIKQVILPYLRESKIGELSVNYGWGIVNPDDNMFASDLHVAKELVLSNEDCYKLLPSKAPSFNKQICVNIAACYGDGGSPLVIEHKDSDAELVGLTSWGYLPCSNSSLPTVYTAVSEFVTWITDVQSAYYALH